LEDFESIQEKKRVIHSKIYAYLHLFESKKEKKSYPLIHFNVHKKDKIAKRGKERDVMLIKILY
jgi:hypothetical protein